MKAPEPGDAAKSYPEGAAGEAQPEPADLQRLFKKVWARVVVFLLVSYALAIVDRINVGIAALDDEQRPLVFAHRLRLGAGVFFLGYFLFEIPSVLHLRRVGARRWVSRILITWGLVTIAMAYVKTPMQFYALRFLLGAAEAGLYPGVIYFLTLWFPATYRARVTAGFVVGGPLALVIGAPVSAAILGMDGIGGLKGWQWLFWIDGALTVGWGCRRLVVARRRSRHGTLAEPKRSAMADAGFQPESARSARIDGRAFARLLIDRRIWLLIGIYFGVVAGLFGVAFWLPQVVKAFGLTNLQTGFVIAIPYALATITMFGLGAHSDRSAERVWHIAVPLLAASAAFAATRFVHDPRLLMMLFSIAAMGLGGDAGPVLDLADVDIEPRCGAHRHRVDQFGEQPCRFPRAVSARMDQGANRQYDERLPGAGGVSAARCAADADVQEARLTRRSFAARGDSTPRLREA